MIGRLVSARHITIEVWPDPASPGHIRWRSVSSPDTWHRPRQALDVFVRNNTTGTYRWVPQCSRRQSC